MLYSLLTFSNLGCSLYFINILIYIFFSLFFFIFSVEEELEKAFEMKNFSVCDALQDTIRDIQFARSKLPLPELLPKSRKELELMLLEAAYTLDHTRTVHDLILCSKLELRIQQLESQKNIHRTVEEEKENLRVAVEALDDAMVRKEFKKCAQLQQVRTYLQYRLYVPISLLMVLLCVFVCLLVVSVPFTLFGFQGQNMIIK